MLVSPTADYVSQNPPPLSDANVPDYQQQGENVEKILLTNGECDKLQETNSERRVDGDRDVLTQSTANASDTGQHAGPQTSHVSVNALELRDCMS